LLADADETPTVRRLRLEAQESIGSPAERAEALSGLDELVNGGGPESVEAAFIRLAATLGKRPAAWNPAASLLLKQSGHERAAIVAEAMYLAQHEGFDEAEELLRPYGRNPWALSARLRAAMTPNADRDEAAKAAEALLAVGPSHSLRVEAGQGLARSGKLPRAREVLINVARDPGAQEAVRAEAYKTLMSVVGNDLNDWEAAAQLHAEWVQVAPLDPCLSKWAPRIGNRRRRS
jgi:predicted Zn-dependent protease